MPPAPAVEARPQRRYEQAGHGDIEQEPVDRENQEACRQYADVQPPVAERIDQRGPRRLRPVEKEQQHDRRRRQPAEIARACAMYRQKGGEQHARE
jgi:hypothetical protein